jgi:hypothetical protein
MFSERCLKGIRFMSHTNSSSLPVVASTWLLLFASPLLVRPADAQTLTLRYDLASAPLEIFGLEFLQEFAFPVEPADIVKTRFHLVYDTTSFPSQEIALGLQPPIFSDDPGSGGFLTEVFTGADFGWSGTGHKTFDGETDVLNGEAIPAPPGSAFLLYAVSYFNARRLADPSDIAPIGGQFTDSWIEVDYVLRAVPEPASSAWIGLGALALGRRARRRS